MRRIRIRKRAEGDLIGIWKYTFEQWDAGQADRCLDEFDGGISQLAANPELGVRRDEVRKGYRVLFINSYAIYYTAAAAAVQIIRVLHNQMDPERHL